MTIARWLGPALLLAATALSGCTSSTDENEDTVATDTGADTDTGRALTARPPTVTPPKAVVPSFTGNPVTSF